MRSLTSWIVVDTSREEGECLSDLLIGISRSLSWLFIRSLVRRLSLYCIDMGRSSFILFLLAYSCFVIALFLILFLPLYSLLTLLFTLDLALSHLFCDLLIT